MRGSGAFRTSIVPGGALAGPWVRNPLWRNARAVPSIDLQLSDSKSLVDSVTGQNLITFTRASTATYVGSDRLIKTAVTNLRTYSEAVLGANSYSATNATLTAVTTTFPAGINAASLLVLNAGANTGSNTDGLSFGAFPLNNSTQHTQSVFVKPAGATVLRLRSNSSGLLVDFTLTGSGTAPSAISDLQGASIVSLPNGWYRVSWTFTTTTSAPGNRTDYWTVKTNVADGVSGIYVTGVQVEQSPTMGEYVFTTSVANSAPRFTHDPATGESLGLLIEEARTNLMLRSEEFDNSHWVKQNVTATANNTVAPNGATTADLILETTINSNHAVYTNPVTFTTATQSIYVKPNGRTNVSLRFLFTTNDWIATVFSLTGAGSITQTSASTTNSFSAVSRTITDAGNGWYRISMTTTQTSRATYANAFDLCTTSTPTLTPADGTESYLGDVTKGVYIWGAQLEAGSIPTSYIATVASTVTRAADVATITGTNFTSWFNASAGTTYFRGKSSSSSAAHWSFDDSTASNRITTNASGGGATSTFSVSVSGTDSCSIASTSFTLDSTFAQATAYALNDFANTVNSGTVGTDTLGPLPVVNRATLGSRISQYHNGTIARFTYWPTRLANSTLQAVTAP